MDFFNLPHPVICLVRIAGRLSIPPDVIYQVVIDPARISPSRKFLQFDQRTQQSDVHGWFDISSIEVVEELGACTSAGQPLQAPTAEPNIEAAQQAA